jgi:hypothetical protein
MQHELIHAADGGPGHQGPCAEAATRLSFEGPMTGTVPSADLAAEAIAISEKPGPFPAATLTVKPPVAGPARSSRARRGRHSACPRRAAGHPHDQGHRLAAAAKINNTLTWSDGQDGGIRTRGLLLPNQVPPVARCRLASPNVAFAWDDARWTLA